jgi:hypothetical protein
MSDVKHVGRVRSTGKKCIVVFRTLPGDAYNCLIAPTENLPDSYHDAMINLVESSGGQSSNEFGEVMARSTFPDGSIMLAALHTQGRLIKVSTDQIDMIPNSTTRVQLSELNQIIAEQNGVSVDALSLKSGITEKPKAETEVQNVADIAPVAPVKFDEPAEVIADLNDPVGTAKLYRSQADKLAKQAAEFRRKAEELAPTKKTK